MRPFSPTMYDYAAMDKRLEDIETRVAYQEAAIDELTSTTLAQQQTIEALQGQIDYLKSLLKDLTPSAVAPMSEETPPPHY
ncbi:MAG: SlyX family protein [Pseudomonadota bacterium]